MARILITGCSSGIGRACAVELTRRGHEVVASARDRSSLATLEVAERLELDVCDADSVRCAVEAAGDVEVLVNNAGVTAWGPVELMAPETVRRVLETNVIGVLGVTQAVLPAMRARGRGRIVTVSSAGRRARPLLGCYVASKAALEAFSEALAAELRPFGVDVVLLEPGGVATSFAANRIPVELTDPAYAPVVERATAHLAGLRGKVLSPEDVAAEVAEIVDAPDPPLRWPVGALAARLLAERCEVSDADFAAQMRAVVLGASAPSEPDG